MNKVSIIVPLYKSESFLRKLTDSIIAQTYGNLELIFVNDGSPDNSGKIADEYAKKDSRIRVIHQDNAGTCSARNKGLSVATGEYLMFADGDDWLELDCIEYLVSLLEKNNADMSMTDAVFTTRNRSQNEIDKIRIWTNEQAVAGIINTFIIPVGPWNKLYKMKVVRDNNITFSVDWFGEGLYFSTMVAQASSKVAVGHRKVYNYRLNNPNSGCTKHEVKNGISALNNIFYIKNNIELQSPQIEEAFNWHIWMNYYNLFTFIVGAGEEKTYSEDYIEAKRKIKELMPLVIKHSLLTSKQKMAIILKSLFPAFFAKRSLRKAKTAFLADTME